MRTFKPLAVLAALAIALVGFGTVSAVAPTDDDTAEVDLVILGGSEFSIDITGSGDWTPKPFSLTGPANWTNSTWFNIEVVDMRGTGDGWTATVAASAFVPAIANASVMGSNNTNWSSLCTTSSGYCAGTGAITTGVSAYGTSVNFSNAGGAQVLASTMGINSPTQPHGTGTFTQQSAIYYNGIAPGLAAGTYSTTITATLVGEEP